MKEKILELRRKGLTINKIVEELGCAKSTVSYHINNNDMGQQNKLSDELVEEIRNYYNAGNSCQKTADKYNVGKTTVRSYVDIRPRKVLTDEERKQDAVKAVAKRRRKVKEMSVEYKGGCCERCGYNKCIGALEFHHLNPIEKDFSISVEGVTKSWEKIKNELDKCILVCANCHREIHEELRNNKDELL